MSLTFIFVWRFFSIIIIKMQTKSTWTPQSNMFICSFVRSDPWAGPTDRQSSRRNSRQRNKRHVWMQLRQQRPGGIQVLPGQPGEGQRTWQQLRHHNLHRRLRGLELWRHHQWTDVREKRRARHWRWVKMFWSYVKSPHL